MEYTIESFDHVESTNTLLMERALGGAPEGSVILARSQSAGKGRSGRSFYSPCGNLYMSVLIRPEKSPGRMQTLTPMVAVCVLEAVRDVMGIELGIKWVNDLFLGGHKVGGILVESRLSEDGTIGHAVIGIGINVFSQEVPEELKDILGFLSDEKIADGGTKAAAEQDRTVRKLGEKILERFAYHYERSDDGAYMNVYRKASVVTGKTVTYHTGSEEKTLEVLSITDQGELVAKDCTGRIQTYHDGEISIRI